MLYTFLFMTLHSHAANHKKYGLLTVPYATKKITLENQTNSTLTISYHVPDHGFGGPEKKRKQTIKLESQTTHTIKPVLEHTSRKRLLTISTETTQEPLHIVCKPTESQITFITTQEGHTNIVEYLQI